MLQKKCSVLYHNSSPNSEVQTGSQSSLANARWNTSSIVHLYIYIWVCVFLCNYMNNRYCIECISHGVVSIKSSQSIKISMWVWDYINI